MTNVHHHWHNHDHCHASILHRNTVTYTAITKIYTHPMTKCQEEQIEGGDIASNWREVKMWLAK